MSRATTNSAPKSLKLACLAAAVAWPCVCAAADGSNPFPTTTLKPSAYAGLRGAPAAAPRPRPPLADAYGSETAAGAQTVRIDLGGNAPTRALALPRGKSAIIDLPVEARDVLVSDPKVADVALSTPRRIYVMGVAAGQTDATFVDGMGRQILRLEIRVDQDTSAIADTLNRVLPNAHLRVEAANQSLILSGEVRNPADADKAVRIASSFVANPNQVVNMIGVAAPEQVMLKVRIVEVNRSVIKQLGVNLNAVLGQVGMPQYAFSRANTWGVSGSLLGGLSGGYKYDSTVNPADSPVFCSMVNGAPTCVQSPQLNLDRNNKLAAPTTGAGARGWNKAESTLQAFERVGLVRTLAEPNLTAISGESAKFLAGGEFPVPVAEDNNGRVTIEFKPYGVGLGFTPVVLANGRISLKISTEVSELTSQGSFTLAGSNGSGGLSVPGLSVRRAETVVELPSGGATMIAGLLQSQSKQALDSLPGLMQVPVLGALFRSRDFLNNESELVVIATPYLTKAVSPDQLQTPADGLQIASDVETNLLGRLNRGFGRQPPAGQTYQGPIGYVVD